MGRIAVWRTLIKVSLTLSLVMGLILINACGEKEERQTSERTGEKTMVEKGDKVKVQYTGKFEDGTIFDQSKEGEPLEFTVGSRQVIPGFDQAVEGMKLNEEKEVAIKTEDAYGERDETLMREFPRSNLPETLEPEEGMVIRLQDQTGRPIPATIVGIGDTSITIDLNHPLAGKDLIFNIKVVGIE